MSFPRRLFTRGGAEKLGLRSTNPKPGVPRMNLHKNARLTEAGRALLVARIKSGWPVRTAAEAAAVSRRTTHKWLGRDRRGGERRLCDRSSAPRRCPPKVSPQRIAQIERLRGERMTGPQIAAALGMMRTTVGLVLRRLGLGKLRWLEPSPHFSQDGLRPPFGGRAGL